MENLKALVHGRDLTTYQKGLALQEFEKLSKRIYSEEQVQELMRETYYKGRNDENLLSYKDNPELEFNKWFEKNKK